uniref:Reverse transcriptase domain-containing protein n=1 Tax=Xenopus tropicalis TaxID=8364 RepID=A0A803JQT4_XENTR
MCLLSKGLSFSPVRTCDTFQLDIDLERFFRNLRLKSFFSQPNTMVIDALTDTKGISQLNLKKVGLRKKSNFVPPATDPIIETYIKLVKSDISDLKSQLKSKPLLHTRHNLTLQDKRHLSDILSYKQVIFKPADKGGALVILDKNYYVNEIKTQLADESVYCALPKDPLTTVQNKIMRVVEPAFNDGVIDVDLKNFLYKVNPITPVFYTIPKIHKDLHHPPGRPIVANTDSVFSPLSIYLDKVLQPIMRNTKSFLKDTSQLLNILNDCKVTDQTLLASLDVNSLYTSIAHIAGLDAVEKWLHVASVYTEKEKAFFMNLLEIVLYDSYFMFGDIYYKQLQGTAMGSNVAPTYANLYMANFEDLFVYTNTLFQQYCSLYYRYIDDIIIFWEGSADTLVEFYENLNSVVPKLKFSLVHDTQSINFLDVTIRKMGTQIETDLYQKHTDRNNLLHNTSFHPRPLLKSLPITQFKRVKRIVSNKEQCDMRLNQMSERFVERGYPKRELQVSLDTAKGVCDAQLRIPLDNGTREKGERLAFVSQFSVASEHVRNIIRKHWQVLKMGISNVKEFSIPPLMAYKRNKNLKDLLVRADIGPQKKYTQRFLGTPKMGTFPCLSCAHCNNITKGEFFTHPHTGRTMPIRKYFTCDSMYVVYLIKCPCGLAYIGETTQKVKDRIKQHKSNIRCKQLQLPIPAHFHQMKHSISQLRYQVIDNVDPLRRGGDRQRLLKKLEMRWINTLGTLSPGGLNREYTPMMFI